MLTTIQQLEKNKTVFFELLKDIDPEMLVWKQAPEKWDLLHMVCHLYDEERDDFRFRINWLLENPGEAPPPFNPLDWVETHDYKNQDYNIVLTNFLNERAHSITWLKGLNNPNWESGFVHSKVGTLTAKYFLSNWLAHDYLHIRQILKLKFDYLEYKSGNNLNYAGKW